MKNKYAKENTLNKVNVLKIKTLLMHKEKLF